MCRTFSAICGTRTLVPGDADTIRIRVYDGAGGLCLHETEHEQSSVEQLGNQFTTIHRACWERQASIQVEAYEIEDEGGDGGGLVALKFVFWGVSLMYVCVCSVRFGVLPSLLARGRGVDAD